ncbi:MAG: CBS domain-containing protein [Chloroflexi bacterium]|nr:CBS domain-containing protein [Chloroflexota bacterium]
MGRTGSIRLFHIGGIAVDLHWTFFLIILAGGWQGWLWYGTWLGIAQAIAVIVLLFASTLLHEVGHTLQARALGLTARRIVLLPIGGLAQLETPPTQPGQELLVALAGPWVNLGAAVILGVAIFFVWGLVPGDWAVQITLSIFSPPTLLALALYTLAANMMLFAFNMLPAFPMDGGRILRAGLAMATDYELATRVASWLGRVLSLLLLVLAFFGWPPLNIPPNPLLAIVTPIIYFGAQYEERYVRRQRALVRLEARDLCQSPDESLSPWQNLSDKLVRHLFRLERPLPVVVEGRLVGLLGYQDIRRNLKGLPEPVTVAHVMQSEFPSIQSHETLWVTLQEMNAARLDVMPVVDQGQFKGLILRDNLNFAWRYTNRAEANTRDVQPHSERMS